MIITKYFKTREDGVKLYHTYSNQNNIILQIETGIRYNEAIDVENAPYTYEETDEQIVQEPIEKEIQKQRS